MRTAALASLLVGISYFGCASAERAAARDPMKCERDPKCASEQGKARDCDTQCNYDPACTDRCREMRTDPGVGHR